MASLTHVKPERITLKGHGEFTEKWLQEQICRDPSILPLEGDLYVIYKEKTLPGGGRLDLLLFDRKEKRRYEVELMLGATDESHIIRCIEYWDIERRRYPGYEHCAVIVAEDITTRFLNLLGLFGGTIPIIAIQLSALKIGDQIVLNFVKVLDRATQRVDDEEEGNSQSVDRDYWSGRSCAEVLEVADRMLEIINETANPKQRLNYTQGYIGLHNGAKANNFIIFQPKKKSIDLSLRISAGPEWVKRLKDGHLDAGIDGYGPWVTLRPKEWEQYKPLLKELIHQAVKEYQAQ
ncbi:MAG: hypothetical protein ABSE73_10620 [Planctomycetota bacterium]